MHRVANATAKKCCRGLCTNWTCPGTFHKVGGLGQENLNVYHYYSSSNQDLDRKHEDPEAKHGLILQNTSSSDIAIGNVTNGIEHSRCNCQRCNESLHHICNMLHKVNVVKKQKICGICDHCKKDYHKSVRNKCEHCNEVIRSFMYLLRDGKECPRLKEWFRKIRHLPCGMLKGLKQESMTSARTLRVDELFPVDFIEMQRHKSADYNEDVAGLSGSTFMNANKNDQTQLTEIADYDTDKVGLDRSPFKNEKEIRGKSKGRASAKAQVISKRKGLPLNIEKNKYAKADTKRNIPTTHNAKLIKNDAISKSEGNSVEKTKKEQVKKDRALKSEFLNDSGSKGKRTHERSVLKNSDDIQKLSNRENDSTEVTTRKKKDYSDATTNALKTQKEKDQSNVKNNHDNSEIEKIKKKRKSEQGGPDLLMYKKGKSDGTDDASVQKKIDLKEVKAKVLERDVLEKKDKVPDVSLNDTIIKPEIKATLTQMQIFEAKAKEQRVHAGDDKNKVKSTMSSYTEEIARRLALDKLPQDGKIFHNDNIISAHNSIDQQIQTDRKHMHERCFASLDKLSIQPKEHHGEAAAQTDEYGKMIVGNKVRKRYLNLVSKPDHDMKPLIFKIKEENDAHTGARGDTNANENDLNKNYTKKDCAYQTKTEQSRGVIRYALSDRQFIDKGWTMLPTEKIVQKMNVYRMKTAQLEYDWFYRNRKRCPLSYDTGERLAEINENGNGRWFYRNGRVALDYYSAEDMNVQRRFVVYSSGRMDDKLQKKPVPPTVLACFDWIGNGIVYDHSGNIRLKYNQTEGILLETSSGPTTHWKWHALNDPPVLQQIIVDTQLFHKDPKIMKYTDSTFQQPKETSNDEDEMVAIEYETFANEKRKKLSQEFKPFKIKAKVLKMNEQFSLRVLDQATVCLLFRDGKNCLKVNLGMSLDPREIVDTDTIEVGEVANSYDRLPARTESIARIQEIVANAKKLTKCSIDQQRRIRRPVRQLSLDRFRSVLYTPTKL